MLRLQRSDTADPWRATLENAHTGEVMRFSNETKLLQHLFLKLSQQSSNRRLKGVEQNESAN